MSHDKNQSQAGIQQETIQTPLDMDTTKNKDVSHVERILSPDDDLKKDAMDPSRVDKEVWVL